MHTAIQQVMGGWGHVKRVLLSLASLVSPPRLSSHSPSPSEKPLSITERGLKGM